MKNQTPKSVSSPTKQHVSCARRRLVQFVHTEIYDTKKVLFVDYEDNTSEIDPKLIKNKTEFQTPKTEFQNPKTEFQTSFNPNTEFQTPKTEFQSLFNPKTESQTPKTEFQTLFNPKTESQTTKTESQKLFNPKTNIHSLISILPEEIISYLFSFLSGKCILSFSCTCRNINNLSNISKCWPNLVKHKLEKLGLVNHVHLGTEMMGRKSTFIVLCRYYVPIFSAMLFLGKLERPEDLSKEEAGKYCEQVEFIFSQQLKLVSPWKVASWNEKLRQDLQNFRSVPGVTVYYTPNDNIVRLKLEILDGFYKDELINFVIKIGETYPYDPPVVHATSPIYHPMLSECGLVNGTILSRACWRPHYHTISDVILGIQSLFLDSSYLTNYFTL